MLPCVTAYFYTFEPFEVYPVLIYAPVSLIQTFWKQLLLQAWF